MKKCIIAFLATVAMLAQGMDQPHRKTSKILASLERKNTSSKASQELPEYLKTPTFNATTLHRFISEGSTLSAAPEGEISAYQTKINTFIVNRICNHEIKVIFMNALDQLPTNTPTGQQIKNALLNLFDEYFCDNECDRTKNNCPHTLTDILRQTGTRN